MSSVIRRWPLTSARLGTLATLLPRITIACPQPGSGRPLPMVAGWMFHQARSLPARRPPGCRTPPHNLLQFSGWLPTLTSATVRVLPRPPAVPGSRHPSPASETVLVRVAGGDAAPARLLAGVACVSGPADLAGEAVHVEDAEGTTPGCEQALSVTMALSIKVRWCDLGAASSCLHFHGRT